MFNTDIVEKKNIKVLGLLVRYKRIHLGFSLRGLAEMTNISHTLISNFERGLVVPHKDTIKEIFSYLKLDFHDDPEISIEFKKLYKEILRHILYYEYTEAKELINLIEKKKNVYNSSIEVVNYYIIRLLYYTISNIFDAQVNKEIKEYEGLLDFFSDNQKQLFYFIKGLNYLNQEYYKQSREFFEMALKLGSAKLYLLIKEHYVIALSKSYKFVDSRKIADECILEYENQTNYVRAMRLRTRIAHDYINFHKFENAKEIYETVLNYSIKFNLKDLENRSNTRLAQIARFQKNHELSKHYLGKVTPEYSRSYYYIKFDILVVEGDEKKLEDFYKFVLSEPQVVNHRKSFINIKTKMMEVNEKYLDKKEYEKLLDEEIKLSLISDDAEMLEYSCRRLMVFCKNERKYKKGYETSWTLLQYLKYGS